MSADDAPAAAGRDDTADGATAEGTVADPEAWRRPATIGLVALAALGSLGAAIGSLRVLGDPTGGGAGAGLEAWRAGGAVFLAVLYLYLGWRPDQRAGVWELVIGHRVLLGGLSAYVAVGGAGDAWIQAGANLALALVLAGAYVVTRAYRAWDR